MEVIHVSDTVFLITTNSGQSEEETNLIQTKSKPRMKSN